MEENIPTKPEELAPGDRIKFNQSRKLYVVYKNYPEQSYFLAYRYGEFKSHSVVYDYKTTFYFVNRPMYGRIKYSKHLKYLLLVVGCIIIAIFMLYVAGLILALI